MKYAFLALVAGLCWFGYSGLGVSRPPVPVAPTAAPATSPVAATPTPASAPTPAFTMENSPSILCDKCHQREATVHVMHAVSQMRRINRPTSLSTSTPPAAATPPAQPGSVTRVNLCEACARAGGALSSP